MLVEMCLWGVCMCAVRLYCGHMCSCMCSHWGLREPVTVVGTRVYVCAPTGTSCGSTELPPFKASPGDPLLDSFQWPSCLKLHIFIYCKNYIFKPKNKELDTGKNNVS